MKPRAWLIVGLAGVLAACGGDGGGDQGPGAACSLGESRGCACTGGGTGTKACRDDGTWGACACGSAPDDTVGGADGVLEDAGPGDAPVADDVPVADDGGGGADVPGPATCSDGEKNGGESDVDCGGPCAPCATGLLCQGPDDCLGATCLYGRCKEPSCQDGVRNQGEGDVDCGGPCVDCADGRSCSGASDCAGGGCVSGLCCTLNVCGVCAPAPVEVCNGTDDDCDGQTDEGLLNACGACGALPAEGCNAKDDDCDGQTDEGLGPGSPCPKQAGVCAGSKQACQGGSWTCSEATYDANSFWYQAVETSCDGFDNDCDGQTDEGLKNACGLCGPLPVEACNGIDDDCDGQTDEGLLNSCGLCGPPPVEVCNGVDDDCDGQVDELVACASCQAAPAAVELSSLYASAGLYYTIDHANALVAVGTSAYATYRSGLTPATKRLADGAIQQVVAAPGAIFTDGEGRGTPSLAPGGQRVLLTYARALSGSSFHKLFTVPIDASGALTPTVLYDGIAGSGASWYTASASFGDRTLILASVGTTGSGGGWRLYESTDPNAADPDFTVVETLDWGSDVRPQLRFRADGHALAFVRTFKEFYGDWHYASRHLDAGPSSELLVATEATFQPRSDLGFAAAWSTVDGEVFYQEGSDQAPWAAGLELAKGSYAGLGVGPNDAPVVTHTSLDATVLYELRRGADGAFVSRPLLTLPEHEVFQGTSVAVDAAGRAHVAAQVMNLNYSGGARYKLVYLMSCWDAQP